MYPSYVDLDSFIDVNWLKSLDTIVRDRVRRRIDSESDLKFYTGPFLLETAAESVPGPRMVHLSRPLAPDDYYNLDQPDLWVPTEAAVEFGPLMEFIATLPFAATARMLIIYDESGRAVSAHQYHGADATGELSISIRVDGVFNDQFRRQIPASKHASSAAALWAEALSAGR
jgi:hypothetical protein